MPTEIGLREDLAARAAEGQPEGTNVAPPPSLKAAGQYRELQAHRAKPARLGATAYAQLVRDLRREVMAVVPPGSTVAVISKGDNQLLRLKGRVGWHLPQDATGSYAGHHPRDSEAAIRELERLRASGAHYLVVPGTAFWWLDYYTEFRRHLEGTYAKVWNTDRCLIYQLSACRPSPARYARARLRSLLSRLYTPASLPESAAGTEELRVAVDSPIPETFVVGEGGAFFIAGWCYHSRKKLAKLEVIANGRVHALKAWGIPRPDVRAAHFPRVDGRGHSYRSGFWGFVPFNKGDSGVEAQIILRATLAGGGRCEHTVGHVTLLSGHLAPTTATAPPARPLVAICMATYNPPLALFQRQIDSIRAQTFPNWVCLISDDGSRPDLFEAARRIIAGDPRFKIHRRQTGLGFYANFEGCLSLVPGEADFVALSDHDDFWHEDKLETLLNAFDPETSLAYSDMRIVDEGGQVLAPTYWTTRPNNFTRFASLLMANTITGGASMFRRRLLPLLLPFPAPIGEAYHDHWIGTVALAVGKIKYINRPLYDYVQHAANVIGHYAPAEAMSFFPREATLKRPLSALRDTLRSWQRVYFSDLLRLQLMAQTLRLRCASQMSPGKLAELGRIEDLGSSSRSLAWLAARAVVGRGRITETVGAESPLLGAALWRHSARSRLSSHIGDPVTSGTPAPQPQAPESHGSSAVEIVRGKIAPLSLEPSWQAPQRLNLLVPTIDLNYFFGGYIAKFNLARRLAEDGLRVRMVVVDYCDWQPARWREQLRKFDGLQHFFEHVELAYGFDRSTALEVNPRDSFMATTWWTAHIAHHAAQTLRAPGFIYLIQEYEPFTFAMGSLAALAAQSYEFPHWAMFSTELLRTYFRQNRLGVFAGSPASGEQNSVSFENAITDVGAVSARELAQRPDKRLLYYARPEQHATRNMFELGLLGLIEAIDEGCFDQGWEFYGIGSVGAAARIALPKGRYLTLLPRENQRVYRDILRAHDLGLALMYTPHPSLVPIEMASAGMIVVTNAFANKTAETLRNISSNLLAVQPSVAGVKEGLKEAVSRVYDYEGRSEGSRVNWARTWQRAFSPAIMAKMRQFINASTSGPEESVPSSI